MSPTLYWFPVSPFARIVRYFALASGLEHQSVIVDLFKGEQKSEDFKKVNPHQMVPALVDGDLHLYESQAIVRYLANKYNSSLLPYSSGAEAVAKIDRDVEWWLGTVAKPFNGLVFEKVFKPKFGAGPTDETVAAKLEGELKLALEKANELFFKDSSFALGSSLTLLDVVIGVYLSESKIINFDLSAYSKVNAYWEFIKTQDSFVAAHNEFWNILQALADETQ